MRKSEQTPRIGISSCLLGQKVRFDSGHKHDRYITDVLGDYFEFVAVCPEVAIGMGTPREAVRLEGDPANPRMVGNKSGKDWTEKMNRYARQRVRLFEQQPVSGYILKSKSPSCGMERVKVYNAKGAPGVPGRGLYAAELLRQLPFLPVEEEGRLHDPHIRENFIVRVFAFHRLQRLFDGSFTRKELIAFHTAHKYLLLAHSQQYYRELGRLVAEVKQHPPAELRDIYSKLFMTALSFKTTVKKNVNVLQHIVGFLKNHLGEFEKKDIQRVIEDYRLELVPLVVPLTLVRHYIDKYDIEYIKGQHYLNPHPKELMLRNHV
ncbi:MAG: YbgA family protein [Candidatus Zixiibacteriota bacterium]